MKRELKILIVEDEVFSIEYLKDILDSLGFHNLYDARSAKKAINIVKNTQIDLVFMDINIEGDENGIWCAKQINEIKTIPIIFTTAYKDTKTIREASNTYTYGYLVKPFRENDVEASLMITLKHIEQLSKDKNSNNNEIVRFPNGQIYNKETKTFYLKDEPLALTHRELRLIDLFCENPNQNISYELLIDRVWNGNPISDSTIRDSISKLKRKTECDSIENISGYGYVFKID